MMIVKMLLCASVAMLGQAQATEPKPQPKAEQKVEKKAKPQIEKKAQPKAGKKAEAKAAKKSAPKGDRPAQTKPRACTDFCVNDAVGAVSPGKGDSPIFADTKIGTVPKPRASAETTEKVVDGVRLSDVEVNIVSYTNEERGRYGLPPLEIDKELMATAREQAAWMTRSGFLVHTRRPLAENIAMGQTHSSEAVGSWMNSSGHRANILNPGHRRIGVAAYRTAGGVIFWCQQFRQ